MAWLLAIVPLVGGWIGPGASPAAAQEPAAGSLLIASRGLLDPNFSQTVVLLVQYDADGALGVILNRPTTVELERMLPELEDEAAASETVWVGGPVAHWQMVVLYRSESEHEESQGVFEDVRFSASRTVLDELLENRTEFRIYAGYAGWAPGQLEAEIDRGSWHLLPGDPELVFDSSPLELWKELIQRGEAQWVWLPRRQTKG